MQSPTHDVSEIANDYAALMANGDVLAAAQKYWDANIVTLEPDKSASIGSTRAVGKTAALERLQSWLEGNAMSEILIDGPFITGDQFALFIDMEITRRATGKREPFSEIATYTVRGGQIIEERFFYG